MSQEFPESQPLQIVRLSEIFLQFLRLGFTSFGGPAAHIALFHDEFVSRRKWISEAHFLDLLGATNLIPGPNSTEMAIHIGYVCGGWRGMVLAGIAFISPAMLIVLALSWFYLRYGSLPQMEWLLYAIKPVMIAIILQAVATLGKKAVKGVPQAVIVMAALGLYFTGLHPLIILFGSGLVYYFYTVLRRSEKVSAIVSPFAVRFLLRNGAAAVVPAAAAYSHTTLFLTFLKIGSLLYGSGYVLLAFIEADFVRDLGWLTERQLLDAVSLGQITPGPLFTTATFIGYLTGGLTGAVLATVAIFLPSFIFVLISSPFIPRLRRSPAMGTLLDGINLSSLGLMAAVTLVLARSAFIDPLAWLIASAAAFLLLRTRLSSTWLILGAGLIGLLRYWLQ